jgi:arylformamidase
MAVYPGDPEVSIEPVLTIEEDGWEMRRVQINTHDGTHVNVPAHAVRDAKTLDDYSLGSFCGNAVIYHPDIPLVCETGVIFRDHNICQQIAEQIKQVRPRFVGLCSKFVIDEGIEREILNQGIILYENLANTEQLPDEFMFYGMPLRIRASDGSPVRAFAVVE